MKTYFESRLFGCSTPQPGHCESLPTATGRRGRVRGGRGEGEEGGRGGGEEEGEKGEDGREGGRERGGREGAKEGGTFIF